MKTFSKRMKHLKKHDPITYYEMIDNPTGSNADSVGFEIIPIMIVIGIILYMFL